MQFLVDRAVGGGAAPGRVRNPVIGMAVDGCNAFIADNKAADVLALFFDILLNIKNGMVIAAQDLFVLQNGFGCIPVIDLGYESDRKSVV